MHTLTTPVRILTWDINPWLCSVLSAHAHYSRAYPKYVNPATHNIVM